MTAFDPLFSIIIDYVILKEGTMSGPWAQRAYVAPAPRLAGMGVKNAVGHVAGIDFRVGSERVDYVTAIAQRKKALPAPNAYVPELQWKPANNFQKQSATKKVTMTAEIMKKTKQLGPGSHKVKYESRYHGQRSLYPAPSRSP